MRLSGFKICLVLIVAACPFADMPIWVFSIL